MHPSNSRARAGPGLLHATSPSGCWSAATTWRRSTTTPSRSSQESYEFVSRLPAPARRTGQDGDGQWLSAEDPDGRTRRRWLIRAGAATAAGRPAPLDEDAAWAAAGRRLRRRSRAGRRGGLAGRGEPPGRPARRTPTPPARPARRRRRRPGDPRAVVGASSVHPRDPRAARLRRRRGRERRGALRAARAAAAAAGRRHHQVRLARGARRPAAAARSSCSPARTSPGGR